MRISALFVCSQNICRSVAAEAAFRRLAADDKHDGPISTDIDSAGVHALKGRAPESGLACAARLRGYDLSGLSSRPVAAADFGNFERILALDRDVLSILQDLAPTEHCAKLELLMKYATTMAGGEIALPEWDDPLGYARLLDCVEDACSGLLRALRR